MPINPLRMVRECKGVALSILVILFFVRQSVGKEFLQRWSGNTDKSISQALRFLEDDGYLGIFDNPTTNALASLEHVTPEYILAHVTQALGEGRRLASPSTACALVTRSPRPGPTVMPKPASVTSVRCVDILRVGVRFYYFMLIREMTL